MDGDAPQFYTDGQLQSAKTKLKDTLTQKDFDLIRLPGAEYPNLCVDWTCFHDEKILLNPFIASNPSGKVPVQERNPITMQLAMPGRQLHFNPREAVIGVVTCGGLCPGLNDVVRSVTYTARRTYKVKRVVGYRYGFWGLSTEGRESAIELHSHSLRNANDRGGSLLGTSRGPQCLDEMADTLVRDNVKVFVTIGGDGTQRGAQALSKTLEKRGLDIAVIGVPKTIDNDLSFSHRTFGFETAVEKAVQAIRSAAAEARSHQGGVGIVKVMGRHSGFIAAHATLASQKVHLCLIPEVPMTRERFFSLLKRRLMLDSFCVICVGEGFGQDWFETPKGEDAQRDASGNIKLKDIGLLMHSEIGTWLKKQPLWKEGTVKYIDPSYMIRACPAIPVDAGFCAVLGGLAIHEGLRGTTSMLVSHWYSNFVLVPLASATAFSRVISPHSWLWRQVHIITIEAIDNRLSQEELNEAELKMTYSRPARF